MNEPTANCRDPMMADLEAIIEQTADALGCEPDNEKILSAIERLKDDTQRSVTLGLVAAKIAIAELEGSGSYDTAEQAFSAIRKRLNELTKDAVRSERRNDALSRPNREETKP